MLKREFDVPMEVTGGQDTIAVRVPSHPLAQAVLQAFGGGLAAPSANRFGRISPTTAAHVRAEFGDALPIVLDGGPCQVGIESTIVDFSSGSPRILRPGMLDAQALDIDSAGPAGERPLPRVPGALDRHYAPRTPLYLWPRSALGDSAGASTRVLAIGHLPPGIAGIALPGDPAGYAHGLYAALRDLDASGASEIRAEAPPAEPVWAAVRDRLQRAAAG